MNKPTILLVALVLACFVQNICSKSVLRLNDARANQQADEDPMMAMPSSSYASMSQLQLQQPQQLSTVLVEQQARPAEIIQYVYTTDSQAPQESALYQASSQQTETRPAYQVIQVSDEAQQQAGNNCDNKRHEYTPVMSMPAGQMVATEQHQPAVKSAEYPGEIIYVDQNGDSYNPQQQQQQQQQQKQDNQQTSTNYRQQSNAAGAALESSLPATILTEIPVSDMPNDVLEKLKREYGVRVVATRERPGANLVINCDEYANEQNSICNSRQQLTSSYETQSEQQYHPGPQQEARAYAYPSLSSVAEGAENYHIVPSGEHYEQPADHHEMIDDLERFSRRDGAASSTSENQDAPSENYEQPDMRANDQANDDRSVSESNEHRTTDTNEQTNTLTIASQTNEQAGAHHSEPSSSPTSDQQAAADRQSEPSTDQEGDSASGFNYENSPKSETGAQEQQSKRSDEYSSQQ